MTLQQAIQQREQESTENRVKELLKVLQPAPYRYRGMKPLPSTFEMKVCGTCWEELRVKEFQIQASSKDGRRSSCPACNSRSATRSTKRRAARNELLGLVEAGVVTATKFPSFPWDMVGMEVPE